MSKKLISSEQAEVLGPKDSDCGSIRTILRYIHPGNAKKYMYRYIKEGNKLVCLDDETMPKYYGKMVAMRSPMTCIGTGKEKNICNVCAGDFFYKLDKRNIGVLTCTLSGTISNLNLQKFHDNTVKTSKVKLEDILI